MKKGREGKGEGDGMKREGEGMTAEGERRGGMKKARNSREGKVREETEMGKRIEARETDEMRDFCQISKSGGSSTHPHPRSGSDLASRYTRPWCTLPCQISP